MASEKGDQERKDQERATHPTDASKVKPGDLMAIIHYVKVAEIAPDASRMRVTPVDRAGDQVGGIASMDVIGKELITRALSADYFAEEQKITATEMERILTGEIFNRPISVFFVKENGEERLLRGRYVKPAPFGRSYMEDLDKPEGDRIRLVDHRTIKWLIVDGVKYVAKKK